MSGSSNVLREGPRPALRIALALLVGAGGGGLCFALGTPLPWMIGSMLATLLAALAHLPVQMPLPLRHLVLPIIGVMLGSAFTPELISSIPRWSYSLGALLAYLAVSSLVGYAYFRSVARMAPATAFFCGVPGGMAEMTMVGASHGGDERIISLTHASRIIMVVMLIPLLIRLVGASDVSGTAQPGANLLGVSALDVALMLASAVIGYVLGRRVGLPAAAMVGPMLLSALAHGSGLTEARPPAELVAAAQLILGASIGCRFTGTPPAQILRLVVVAAGATLITLALAVLFGWVLHRWTGLPLPALLIAYAPGGLTEMSLVALALGIDAAFVASHHVLRVLLLVTFAPAAFRLLSSGKGRRS
ncbi:MAG TPA: AbrB family transcriptional regulator [Mesorhizobium sp.]|nr:AbrB family transcriptional regulator [Mesorhizobium sp.]